MPDFPQVRLRRLRHTETFRRMVRETHLSVDDLIYPLFVTYGRGVKEEIPSMPGICRFSADRVAAEAEEAAGLGIPAVLLFGIPEKKDALGSSGYEPGGVVQRAVQAIKKAVPDLVVITDVCLCEYTDHGHCGVITQGEIDNDRTLPLLGKMALSHAEAGADMVAPSDMMDGRVRAIRQVLDGSGFDHIPILAYAAKYSSVFYWPFL